MAAAAAARSNLSPHIPVLLRPFIEAVSPVSGVWLDGTLGAGGYTRALLEAGAERVIGVDRDPLALEMAGQWGRAYGERLTLVRGNFAELDRFGESLSGVVLDLGVSSMQIDQAERGFSFMKDGPLDMRMSQEGPSAADLVAALSEAEMADILYLYGEERASRRIARAIVKAREVTPIKTTLELAKLIERSLPRPKPGQIHPATRSFQAIRIAVNDEYGALIDGLEAAARSLRPGGCLAVVTFHSIEDRMVKRFFLEQSGAGRCASRHAPALQQRAAQFTIASRKVITADAAELALNPRARSAKLRLALRTDAPAQSVGRTSIGMPILGGKR